jgi:hypothetical protein
MQYLDDQLWWALLVFKAQSTLERPLTHHIGKLSTGTGTNIPLEKLPSVPTVNESFSSDLYIDQNRAQQS